MSLTIYVLTIFESFPNGAASHGHQMDSKRLYPLNRHYALSPLDFFLDENILRHGDGLKRRETLKGYSAVVHYLYFYHSHLGSK